MSLASLVLVILQIQLLIYTSNGECALEDAYITKWIDSDGYFKYPSHVGEDDANDNDGNNDKNGTSQEDSFVKDFCLQFQDDDHYEGFCNCTYTFDSGDIYSCDAELMYDLPNLTNFTFEKDLKVFRLRNGKYIKEIRSYQFSFNMQELIIENMSELILHERAFDGINNLKILKLQHNIFKQMGQMEFIFAGLVNLTILNLSFNQITGWKSGARNINIPVLPSLKMLDLSGNPLVYLNNSSFEWLRYSQLHHLILQKCDLKHIDSGALLPVQPTLQSLEMSASHAPHILIESLLAMYHIAPYTSLEGMAFARIGLNKIPYELLSVANRTLKYLSFHGNTFRTLGTEKQDRTYVSTVRNAFPLMPVLEEVDLRSCSIYFIEKNMFTMLPELRTLLLSNNQLARFKDMNVPTNYKLSYLDLSHNPLVLHNVNLTSFPSLEILDLSYSTGKRILKTTFKSEVKNLKKLSLCFSKIEYIEEGAFEIFVSLKMLDLRGNPKLNSAFLPNTFYGLFELEELHLAECNIHDLPLLKEYRANIEFDPLKHLTNLTKLNLATNEIAYLTNKSLQSLEKLESLDISRNIIRSWNTPVFENITHLKHLNAGHNHFNYITAAMIEEFRKFDTLIIAHNPFVCDCSCIEFLKVVKNITINSQNDNFDLRIEEHNSEENSDKEPRIIATRSGFKALYEEETTNNFTDAWEINEDYMCQDKLETEEVTYIPFTEAICDRLVKEDNFGSDLDGLDEENNSNALTITLVAVALVITTFGGITYWKWWYIRYFAILVKNATVLSFMSNDENDYPGRIFNYDIFVSYSDHNREWVLNQLLPHLETKSDFKVCLHERDFQVGIGILENIIASMDQSRCILLVISNPFLRSQWCQFELHLAQHRLMETRREELILLFLEEIPRTKRPKTLNYLMRTKTYITWPKKEGDKEGQKLFWKRLHHAVLRNSVESEKKFISMA